MEVTCESLPYGLTNSFSKLVNDYVNDAKELEPFYMYKPDLQGFEAAITQRLQTEVNRSVLAEALAEQYVAYELTPLQLSNLKAISANTTFTITTAHQPNLFTGPQYFIYKIAHAVNLANFLQEQFSAYKFVPVYYMGSEDADLDELGHFYLEGEKIVWETDQTGAVGRMNTSGLHKIVQRLEGQYAHLPFGKEMVALCRKAYLEHENIQQATLYLVNELFKHTGLLVVIPDNAKLKRLFATVVKKELVEGFSQPLVLETIQEFSKHYKVQTEGRPINLFYLDEQGRRERIEKHGEQYLVNALDLTFTQHEILQLVDERPELFSANVILRGVFQETILPNIAFIGGGGELAYWMELKKVFDAVNVPYPVLVLRNSFMLLNERQQHWQQKAGLTLQELFLPELELLNRESAKQNGDALSLKKYEQLFYEQYEQLQQLASNVDVTLKPHVAAMHTIAIKQLHGLEKKLARAARRNLKEEGEAISRLKAELFPGGGLQERQENFLPLYAKYGRELVDAIIENGPAFAPSFTVMNLPSGV